MASNAQGPFAMNRSPTHAFMDNQRHLRIGNVVGLTPYSDRTPDRLFRSHVVGPEQDLWRNWKAVRFGHSMGLPTVGQLSLRSSGRTVHLLRCGDRLAQRIYRDVPCLRRLTKVEHFPPRASYDQDFSLLRSALRSIGSPKAPRIGSHSIPPCPLLPESVRAIP